MAFFVFDEMEFQLYENSDITAHFPLGEGENSKMAECPIIFINDPLIEITFLRHTKVIRFVGTFKVCLVGLIILKHLGYK